MLIINRYLFIIMIIASFAGSACQRKKQLFYVDERQLPEINLQYRDYGKALFDADTANFEAHLRKIQSDFLPFLDANLDDTASTNKLRRFVDDTLTQSLFNKTRRIYDQKVDWKSMINTSFRRFIHFYPHVPPPVIYTFVSNVQVEQPVMVGQNEVLIALDCFLGADEPAYPRLGIPRYMTARMTPAHLGSAVWAAMYEAHVEDQVLRTRVLDEMIASGKKYLFMEAMLPGTTDYVLFGIDEAKMNWLREHEGEIWTALVSEGMLYSSDPVAFRKLFADGPFTADFSYDAPARIGEWVGWQIMRSYAMQNPGKSLAEVLEAGDAQAILASSRYKPRR